MSSQVCARYCKHSPIFAALISLGNAQSPEIHSLPMIQTSSPLPRVGLLECRTLILGETQPLDDNSASSVSTEGPSHSQLFSSPAPSAPVHIASTTRRIVSAGSIADPEQDSGGGNRVWASNEKASDIFANNLFLHIIDDIWPHGITLDWVEGRDGPTTLKWHNS